MTTGKLTVKQQRFLEFYLGVEPELAGNATKSYMTAYGCSEKCAGASGPRLLENVRIKEAIAKHQERVQEKIDVTAETVLRDAIRFRDIAFGDEPGIYEKMVKDSETGEHKRITDQLCQFNPQALGKALELIGRNRLVQVFRENIEHTHTHHLEQRLAKRAKEVEDAAARRNTTIEGKAEVIEAEDIGEEAQAVEQAATNRKLELVE